MTTPKRSQGNTKTTPKTTAQRQEALRARRALQGLSEVRGIYLPPNQHAAIKTLAKALPAK